MIASDELFFVSLTSLPPPAPLPRPRPRSRPLPVAPPRCLAWFCDRGDCSATSEDGSTVSTTVEDVVESAKGVCGCVSEGVEIPILSPIAGRCVVGFDHSPAFLPESHSLLWILSIFLRAFCSRVRSTVSCTFRVFACLSRSATCVFLNASSSAWTS